MARRDETPITVHVAVLQELRRGEATAGVLISSIAGRTRGRVRIDITLVYKALHYLVDQGLGRQQVARGQAAATLKLTSWGARFAARDADALRGLSDG